MNQKNKVKTAQDILCELMAAVSQGCDMEGMSKAGEILRETLAGLDELEKAIWRIEAQAR